MRPIPWHDIAPEVILQIDPPDTPTLLACSLTHPSWALPAQRRLYHTLKILNREDMCRWYQFDPKVKFIPHIRHLIYRGDQDNLLRPDDFSEIHGGQFTVFKKLHTLEIRHLAMEEFDLDLFRLAFGHLGGTLRALLIRDATVTLGKFLEFLNFFPRLQSLGLDCFTVVHEHSSIPSERPAFRGTLNLSGRVNKHGLRFIVDLTRMLPNFSSVRLRLNLNYHSTQRILEIPGFANHITTMLLGYQDGIPESIDLSRCYNLRTLSVRTKGSSQRRPTSLATQERVFRLLESIASRELEFIVVEASRELSLMQDRTREHFSSVFYALHAACRGLSIITKPYERFLTETFRKGETLARFLGCEDESKQRRGRFIDISH